MAAWEMELTQARVSLGPVQFGALTSARAEPARSRQDKKVVI